MVASQTARTESHLHPCLVLIFKWILPTYPVGRHLVSTRRGHRGFHCCRCYCYRHSAVRQYPFASISLRQPLISEGRRCPVTCDRRRLISYSHKLCSNELLINPYIATTLIGWIPAKSSLLGRAIPLIPPLLLVRCLRSKTSCLHTNANIGSNHSHMYIYTYKTPLSIPPNPLINLSKIGSIQPSVPITHLCPPTYKIPTLCPYRDVGPIITSMIDYMDP